MSVAPGGLPDDSEKVFNFVLAKSGYHNVLVYPGCR